MSIMESCNLNIACENTIDNVQNANYKEKLTILCTIKDNRMLLNHLIKKIPEQRRASCISMSYAGPVQSATCRQIRCGHFTTDSQSCKIQMSIEQKKRRHSFSCLNITEKQLQYQTDHDMPFSKYNQTNFVGKITGEQSFYSCNVNSSPNRELTHSINDHEKIYLTRTNEITNNKEMKSWYRDDDQLDIKMDLSKHVAELPSVCGLANKEVCNMKTARPLVVSLSNNAPLASVIHDHCHSLEKPSEMKGVAGAKNSHTRRLRRQPIFYESAQSASGLDPELLACHGINDYSVQENLHCKHERQVHHFEDKALWCFSAINLHFNDFINSHTNDWPSGKCQNYSFKFCQNLKKIIIHQLDVETIVSYL